MSRIKTRGQLLTRLKRYRKIADKNNTADPKLRAFLDDAYGRVWSHLTGVDAGFGKARRDITLSVASQNYTLPPQFNHLQMLVINPHADRVCPLYGSDKLVERARGGQGVETLSNAQLYYQIEGPGLDWDATALGGVGAYVPYIQRLRFSFELPVSTVIRLSFTMQPPSLADADGTYEDDAQDATVSVDTFVEPLEEAIIGYARLWGSSRGDDKDYSRAAASLREVADDYLASRAARNQQDADNPDRYTPLGNGKLVGY